MTLPAPTRYALGLIEGSLGLVSGSLKEELVPRDLVAELCAVMRGSPLEDQDTPSLEARIHALLGEVEKDSLDSNGYFVRKARWPGAAPFAVCLTHDIDNIERPPQHIEKVKERFGASDYRKWKRGELSLYDNVEEIARREGRAGFHSSFYYMSAEYPLDRVRRAARRIHGKGWEVGLHGDFGTHDSYPKMWEAVKRLERGLGIRPRGLREHYLRFDYAKSWGVMERAGFDYDSTVGNNDRLGFKLGLASPFHPPDGRWRPFRLLELPLTLMDTTLWGYLKKGEEEGFGDFMRLIGMVRDVGGLFTLLWHQEAVRMRGGRIYWDILEELRGSGAFVGSGQEVERWWRAREVPLEAKGGKLITLGGAPPAGLVVQLKVEAGMKVKPPGGSRHRSLQGRRYHEHEISPAGRAFRLELPR